MTLARWAGALLASVLAACTTTTVTTSSGEVVAKGPDRVGATANTADARTRARARADLAAGYYRTGQLAVALDEARRAATIDPGVADAEPFLLARGRQSRAEGGGFADGRRRGVGADFVVSH